MNSTKSQCILQWNCNGLYAHIAELKLLLNELDPFLFCIQETRFKHDHIPQLKGFNCVFHNHYNENNASGGVMICVKSGFRYIEIDLNSNLQAVAIEVYYPQRFTICNIYLPPNQIINQIDIEHIINILPKPFILLGDMNAHSTMWGSYKQNNSGKTFENIILNSGLICLNNGEATRLNVYSNNKSAIDLTIATPNFSIRTEWSTHEDLHYSDHYPIMIRFIDYKNNARRRAKWIMEKANWDEFQESTSAILPSNNIDINQQVTNFTNSIIEAANIAIPKSSEKIAKRTVPWWNDDVHNAIQYKRRLLKIFKRLPTSDNLINYNKAKATARRIVLDAKTNSWRSFVSTINDETPSKIVFNKIAKISGIYRNHSIPSLKINDYIETDTIAILNELGKTLSDASSSENYSIAFLQFKNHSENIDINHIITTQNTESYNKPLTEQELKYALDNCKGSSPGPDNIHYDMIKHLSPAALDTFLSLINNIWSSNVFPDEWRNSIIIPILKPNKPSTDPQSYRPIALTSCLMKVMEGVVNQRLLYCLENKNFFHESQFGFRKRRSTIDPLVILENDIQDAFIEKKHCIAVFFDIKRAYDMVWRHSIITELIKIGIRGNLLKFCVNFMSNRKFQIMLGNSKSNSFTQENGIPQGSKISPTLFLIAINSIFKCIKAPVKALLFADDLTIYVTDKNTNKAQEILQSVINNLTQWSTRTGFQFAPEKMTCIHFHRFRKPQLPIHLCLNSLNIAQTHAHKLLGVWFDSKLTWQRNIESIYKSSIQRINIIKILSSRSWGSEENTLMTVYKAMVRSKLEYGCAVFDSAKTKILQKLQVIQNTCIRIITGAFRTSPVISLHALSGILPLDYRRKQYTISLTSKICSSPQHPLYNSIIHDNPVHNKYRKLKYSTKSFSFRAKDLFRLMNIPIQSSPALKHRIIPPWSSNTIHFIDNLVNLNREYTSSNTYKQMFYEIINNLPDHINIYTDGSRIDNQVGCAFQSSGVKMKYHLPPVCSIFTAELYAIYEAIKYTIFNNIGYNTIIITDSLSSIQAIQQPYSSNYIVQDIQQELNRVGPQIKFLWVPSHKGIYGNELADQYAKESLADPISEIYTPLNNLKSYAKRRNIEMWQEIWKDTKDNKLRNIKEDTIKWKYKFKFNRQQKIVLNRLMIGHCNITHKHIFNREPPPQCQHCTHNPILTVEHILVYCTSHTQTHPNLGNNLKEILGTTDYHSMQTLMHYLQSTDNLKEI